MRLALILSLLLTCCALPALEPRDEALLARYVNGDIRLPGAIPVGYSHQFEVGDLQEAEVLDRGVYRTVRFHIVAKLDDRLIVEVHNGRGLVFAGLMDNNGVFSKAWAARAGAKPYEIRLDRNPHMQAILHDGLRAPWPAEIYNIAATSYSEGEMFNIGATELTVKGAVYHHVGVRYELLHGHGEENWFGPYWQWTAEGTVLFRVTRREKIATAQPLLDWSEVVTNAPKPVGAPVWTPPLEGWKVIERADGSTLVFSFDSEGEFVFLDADLNPVSDAPRIGPFGRRKVDAVSPGPFVVPAGLTLQLQPPNSNNWAELDFLMQQAARLPVSMLVLVGTLAGDRGLLALKDYPGLQALDVFPLGAPTTEAGFKVIAGLRQLRELNLSLAPEDKALELLPLLKGLTSVRKLALRSPELTQIPPALRGWKSLESIELTGKDFGGIGELTGLNAVSLVHSELSRATADEIAGLKLLRRLELHSTKFPPSLLKKISKLEEMVLTGDTPEEATFLIDGAGNVKQLKFLELAVIKLAGQDLHGLRGSSIETLVIRDGLNEPTDVAAIGAITNLKTLVLDKIGGASHAGLEALVGLKKLKSLTIIEPPRRKLKTDPHPLAHLAQLTQLEELNVQDARMDNLEFLGLSEFKQLKHLSLTQQVVTEPMIAALIGLKLDRLNLSRSLLPKAAAAKLATMQTLQMLDLRACLSVMPNEVEALKAALPACDVRS